jgi:hypothetical protein
MRTKTLILTVALSAAGIATSLAQVYSVNAVGYVNQTIPNNFSMIANPFETQTNTLNALLNPNELPGAGIGVSFYKFVNGNYRVSAVSLFGGEWLDDQANPNGDIETLDFGHGAFLLNQTGAPFTKTWVGEVAQSSPPGTPVTNPIPLGFSIRSSKIPQGGLIQTDLGFPATAGDDVYKFLPGIQNYAVYNNSTFGAGGGGTDQDWFDGDANNVQPTLEIGESVFVSKVDTKSWDRVFSVN